MARLSFFPFHVGLEDGVEGLVTLSSNNLSLQRQDKLRRKLLPKPLNIWPIKIDAIARYD